MSDQLQETAEQARFAAFIENTLPDERDCVAFREFEAAIINATECASMIDPYDGGLEGEGEHAALKLALSGMLYKVLPRVNLGVLLANAAGICYALRSYLRGHSAISCASSRHLGGTSVYGKRAAPEQVVRSTQATAHAARHRHSLHTHQPAGSMVAGR
jgi:hypothetical protein